ncbi:DUF4752 family protein [Klebsiella oxytoca]|uniref:DUF4752 family protein n=1 Tax=Klebsiella oxytoca TaxID=571 RepID=UPI0025974FE3|nr:DUF4752 family protein [Klebsiella oxytoca]MDM4190613.1 DUF4752 family protein [Klebsiella oxytoca]MDM4224033.1 DUF4752 family protein [Klebsiella oxytoca]MDM4238136.1 DUF4752 family protein [Klebsiella oxytoca]MDM4334594.1 DUF4752 family protein [Klebsiella oxytoca]MDM4365154.1 DUF4752 family protein [Klebsiella oxytoca]
MKEATSIMHLIIASIGMLYIMYKASEWIVSVLAKEWCKRRKESVKQKAVNDICDAFELGKITPGETVKIATKDSLVIMMYREKTEV